MFEARVWRVVSLVGENLSEEREYVWVKFIIKTLDQDLYESCHKLIKIDWLIVVNGVVHN